MAMNSKANARPQLHSNRPKPNAHSAPADRPDQTSSNAICASKKAAQTRPRSSIQTGVLAPTRVTLMDVEVLSAR